MVKKKSACNAGDWVLIPGLGRSPGEGNSYPLQYSCLRIPGTEKPGGLQSIGSQIVGHDCAIKFSLSNSFKIHPWLQCDLFMKIHGDSIIYMKECGCRLLFSS